MVASVNQAVGGRGILRAVGADGKVTLYSGWSTTDVIVDVLGWFN